MSLPRPVVRLQLVIIILFTAISVSVAQNPPVQPMCVEGCNTYVVRVTPDGSVLPAVPVQTGGYKATYTVYNSGTSDDTYSYSCSGTFGVVCDSVKPTSAHIPSHTYATKWQRPTAYYHVGASAGNGTIKVRAWGEGDPDWGTYVVPIYIPQGAPVVSMAPHNGVYRKVGQCVASCFDMVWSHSTVPYFSLGQARSLTLVYNSSTVKPTPVVSMDVHVPTGNSPTNYSVQVKRVSTGAFLTLLNGSQTVWYTAQGTNVVRLSAAIDAQANGLGTGAYDIEVAVTAHYGNGPVTTSVFTRLIVVDRTGPYGEGVDLAGIQHLYIQPDGSALITEGDGSASLYEYEYGLPFHTPAGATDRLTSPSGTYRRTAEDGSYIEFNSSGRMNKAVDRFGNTTTLTYGSSGRLWKITDPMGKVLTVTYVSGKLKYVKDPDLRTTTYTVTNSRLVSVKDPDNVSTTLAYNTATNQITGITDRGGHLTSITYDAMARIDTVKAPSITLYTGSAARPTTIFKSADRVTWQPGTAGTSAGTAKPSVLATAAEASVTDPQGAVTRYRLDRFGAATRVTDILGKVTTITRDTMSRVTYVTEPNGHQSQFNWSSGNEPPSFSPYHLEMAKDVTTSRTMTFTYNADGDLAAVTGGPTGGTYTYHDGSQGPAGAIKTVSVGGTTVTHWPDSRGRDILVVHDDTTHREQYHYESVWGNRDWAIDPRGSKIEWHYDDLGRVDTTTVPLSGKSVVTYGLMNQVLTGKDPLLQVTQNTYDASGLLTRVTDPKGQIYKFVYNALGDLVARHDLGDTTKADTLKYDIMGNVRTARTRRGDVISMTYDVAGRMLTRSGPDFPTDTYRYDPAGRWMVATNAIAYDSLNYDAAGRMVRSFQEINGKTWQWNYTYDIHNRLTQRVDAAGQHKVYLGWSSGGGLSSVSATGEGMQFERVAAESLSVRRIYGNVGNTWSARRTITKAHSDSTVDYPERTALNAAFGVAFQFDSLNRLVSKKYNGKPKRQFTYDALGRLANACDSTGSSCVNLWGGPGPRYKFDATGNRLAAGELFTGVGAGNRVWHTLGWYYNYDLNGNVTSKCSGTTYCIIGTRYTWDALGRLKNITTGTGALIDSMGYDAFGRRVRKTTASGTEWYVYDGEHVAFDVNNSNAIRTEYGYYPGTDALYTIKNPSWTGIALTDPRIGSVIGLADTLGNMKKRYDIDPWGQVAGDTGVITRHRMAGREYDQESGLYYMRARYYSPEIGRFLSEDPIGIAGGLNLYVYAGNNPVNMLDPFGLDPECPKDGSPARLDDGTFCLAEFTGYGNRQPLPGRPFLFERIPGGSSLGSGMGFGAKGGGGSGGGGSQEAPEEASWKTCNRVLLAVTCFLYGPGSEWIDQVKEFRRPAFRELVEPYPLNAEKRAWEETLKQLRRGAVSRFLLRIPLLILVVPSEVVCVHLNLPCAGRTPPIA